MISNGSIMSIVIQFIINGNHQGEDGKLDNNIYIQAILKKDEMNEVILPIDSEGYIGEYDPQIDYDENLKGGVYEAITEKLSTMIFNRIAEKI